MGQACCDSSGRSGDDLIINPRGLNARQLEEAGEKGDWDLRRSTHRASNEGVDDDLKWKHLPNNDVQVQAMLNLSSLAQKSWEKLGVFEFEKCHFTQEQNQKMNLFIEGGPYKLEDGVYQGQWWEQKRQGKGT